MPFSTIKKNSKEYTYFVAGSSKRLYLGTPEKPKVENIKKALDLLDERHEKIEEEKRKIKSFFPTKNKELDEKPIEYKLVVFDLDGVLYQKPWHEIDDEKVAVSTWDILFQELGPTMYEMHEKLKNSFKTGLFKDYMEWTYRACGVLQSCLTKDKFEEVINKRQLMLGAVELFEELLKNNVKTALVSGSFEALAQRAAKELGGINHILAHCKLNFDSRGLLESWNLKQTDYKDKVALVEKLAEDYKISIDKCAYVGDDVNDSEVFKKVGLAIAFNCAKPQVRAFAHVVIKSQDLRDIIPHLKFNTKT